MATDPLPAQFTRDQLLVDAALDAATDRIAWAMLVASGEQSPRKVWAERADEWREYAGGVWRASLDAAIGALDQKQPESEDPC